MSQFSSISAPIFSNAFKALSSEVLIDAAIIGGVSWLGYEAVKHGNEVMQQAYKPKEESQRDGIPKTNKAQNKQVEGAVREIEDEIGRKLTDDEREELHWHISGRDYGYHDIVEDGIELFKNRKPGWKRA